MARRQRSRTEQDSSGALGAERCLRCIRIIERLLCVAETNHRRWMIEDRLMQDGKYSEWIQLELLRWESIRIATAGPRRVGTRNTGWSGVRFDLNDGARDGSVHTTAQDQRELLDVLVLAQNGCRVSPAVASSSCMCSNSRLAPVPRRYLRIPGTPTGCVVPEPCP